MIFTSFNPKKKSVRIYPSKENVCYDKTLREIIYSQTNNSPHAMYKGNIYSVKKKPEFDPRLNTVARNLTVGIVIREEPTTPVNDTCLVIPF